MATICDFKECQKIISNNEINITTVNNKKFTLCHKCVKAFNEFFKLYLNEPEDISLSNKEIVYSNSNGVTLSPYGVLNQISVSYPYKLISYGGSTQ